MNFAGSRPWDSWFLKNSGSTQATSMKVCIASCRRSSSPACASCCSNCMRTPVVPSNGAQACFSNAWTMRHTSTKAAVLILRLAWDRADCRSWPSSAWACTTSSCKVGTRSESSLSEHSQASTVEFGLALDIRKIKGSSSGQPFGLPGTRLPRGSVLSQTCSASRETTSPIFFCSFGARSCSKRRSSSAASSRLCCSARRAKAKSFSAPLEHNCRNSTAEYLLVDSSTSARLSTASNPAMRLSGSDCFAC
mmetsp:Transcript_70075/g.203126  ORF Transcript_70075/g.203126 Transcript_70075/m.203126 type:complete len:250 (-) Transcript_70075:93-842(-)